jgi:transcription elongation factor Elf1
MPSTFGCPFCKSRQNKWVASEGKPEAEITTYQCKDCLNLFQISHPIAPDEADGEEILEM